MMSLGLRPLGRVSAFLLLGLALALGLAGCRQSGTVVTPVRFDRPRAIAFACFDTTTHLFVERSRCEGLEEVSTEPVGLTALVAQTARGEVAAVDLRTGQVLDSDSLVPGFTFRRVGVDPVAIVVPANAPATTYVASRGSRKIQWIPTADLRPDAVGPSSSTGEVVLDRGSPSDLALSADGTMLFAPLADISALAQIPILADGSLGTPTILDLDGAIPAAVVAPAADPFERICPTSAALRTLPALAPRPTDDFLGLSPAPARVVVDPDNGDLWIADTNLPLIHHFSVDATGATPLASLNVGAPVAELALTPVVPATLGALAESAPARYLYALDVRGGDVMAVDLLDGSASFGAVLSVNSGLATPDRIHFPSRARTLTVLQPQPTGTVCVPGIDSEEETAAAPDLLRGVFLAIGLADGSARIVDVYDLDAACRGGNGCSSPANVADVNVFIRRNEPRIGAALSASVSVQTSPTFSFESSPGVLDDTGRDQAQAGPGLQALDACPDFMSAIWPSTAQDGAASPVVCAATDPWELPAERWTATWEAALPGTGGPGRLLSELDGAAGPWLSARAGGVCARGVLGADDTASLGADDPQAGYGGDEVVITSDLPVASEALPGCEPFLTPTDGTERDPVGFAILAASDDRLRLGASSSAAYSFDDVLTCFPGLLTYEVRSRAAYTVLGSSSGFMHRVAADALGRCAADPSVVVDPTEPRTFLPGRAVAGRTFDNGLVAFAIQHEDIPGGPAPNARAQLTFSLSRVPPGLGASMRSAEGVGATAAIVDELVWSPIDQSLFGVDGHGDRLVQMKTDPFRVVRSLR